MIFIGLDPASTSGHPSGICILSEDLKLLFLGKWTSFENLFSILAGFDFQKSWVGIDGPLQPPHELKYCCFDKRPSCHHRQTTPYKGRYCEYILNKNGFRCFVTSKNGFARKWARRCFVLNDQLVKKGFRTLEVFPHATRKILFPEIKGKKQLLKNRRNLQEELRKYGLKFLPGEKVYSDDELDAVLAALTVWLYSCNKTIRIGDQDDGFIIIPQTELKFPARR
jgi:predicted nuclease with RNAse H fold